MLFGCLLLVYVSHANSCHPATHSFLSMFPEFCAQCCAGWSIKFRKELTCHPIAAALPELPGEMDYVGVGSPEKQNQ